MNFRKVVESAKNLIPAISVKKITKLGSNFLGVCWILLIIAGVTAVPVGYIKNVIGLTRCDFEPSYKAEVIRTIGILAPPVGIIAGWIEIDDKLKERNEQK